MARARARGGAARAVGKAAGATVGPSGRPAPPGAQKVPGVGAVLASPDAKAGGEPDLAAPSRRAVLGASAGLLGLAADWGWRPGPAAAKGGPEVYFDMAVNGEPVGRVTVALFEDVAPAASGLVADLASSNFPAKYTRSQIVEVNPDGYVRCEGVRPTQLDLYRDDAARGEIISSILGEFEAQRLSHGADRPSFSLVVRNAEAAVEKTKLKALNGKLTAVTEVSNNVQPNCTGFALTSGPVSALDATNLVVGEIVGGLDVVRKLEAVPANFSSKDNGFLKAGLAIGDGRATFAKTRIGRPLARVQVLKSGLVAAPKPAEETAELASAEAASPLEGTFTDPFHPGCTRTVTLDGLGGAVVTGEDGAEQPACLDGRVSCPPWMPRLPRRPWPTDADEQARRAWKLEGTVAEDGRAVEVDFGPKTNGAVGRLRGVFNGRDGIDWPDGNTWTRVKVDAPSSQ